MKFKFFYLWLGKWLEELVCRKLNVVNRPVSVLQYCKLPFIFKSAKNWTEFKIYTTSEKKRNTSNKIAHCSVKFRLIFYRVAIWSIIVVYGFENFKSPCLKVHYFNSLHFRWSFINGTLHSRGSQTGCCGTFEEMLGMYVANSYTWNHFNSKSYQVIPPNCKTL